MLDTWGYQYGWGRYFYRRERQVRDNYDKAYAYAGVPVGEFYWINPSANGCNIIHVETGATALRSDGTFRDDYTTYQGIPWCAVHPAPANCSTSTWQTISVEGAWFFTHEVEWRCDNVDIRG